MIRRPPRSTLDRSSAASDVYKRQARRRMEGREFEDDHADLALEFFEGAEERLLEEREVQEAVSYTHLRAHETVLDIVCRLLLEKRTTISMTGACTHSTRTSTTHVLTPQVSPV